MRKRIEEAFGWIKTVGGLRKTRHRGTARVGWMFTLTAAACNLIRLPKLLAGGLTMPGIRPERPVTDSDDRLQRLGAIAEVPFHITEDGNEASHHLISAPC